MRHSNILKIVPYTSKRDLIEEFIEFPLLTTRLHSEILIVSRTTIVKCTKLSLKDDKIQQFSLNNI